MTLKKILGRLNMESVYEVRRGTDEYVELVFYSDRTDEITDAVSEILGPPKKPAGVEPSPQDSDLTEPYGGIWDDQTLFSRNCDDFTVIAMYWPWQDEVHTTLKMARLKK